ncbi:MAG TPA: TIM44-like domain-containing protein, partial [Bacteroidia bacterium]|nr:TIM44-like domain-containing protein [Bacteroidia bacterium]
MFFVVYGYSRAGGGGGHHSSSGGHSSSFHSSSHSFGSGGTGGSLGMVGMIILMVILLIVVIVIFVLVRKFGGLSSSAPTVRAPARAVDLSLLGADFDQQQFLQKVAVAFPAIQDAWMNKDLSKVRRWITDGVYQRFHAQFIMMKLLDQENKLSNIRMNLPQIVETETQGAYQTLTVAIPFTMDDEFISKKHPEFNESFSGDSAIEYWTFIRKAGASGKDLYFSNSCPKCGYELNKEGGEVSKCPSCASVTYLGDYDWVLCEITQEEDYQATPNALTAGYQSLAPLYASEADFCNKLMEDKASNAVMQYFVSLTTHDLKYLRRFMSDGIIEQMETRLKTEAPFIFNRLFLDSVDIIGHELTEERNKLTFAITYSAMRLAETKGGLSKIDQEAEKFNLQLTLSKKAGVVVKNKLWSFECACCGAPYTDTTDTNCTYCEAKINSSDTD